ncbi:MAG: hypothetical protein R2748_05030 [Bryobacterales bacterium]
MLTPLTRILAVAALFAAALAAQTEFQWNNPLPANAPEGVEHATFYSKANKTTVGYNILLPPGYNAPENAQRRYPVIYYLHGGRPGGGRRASAWPR